MAESFSTKVVAKSLVDAVTERLEAAIIAGELAPGERIREQTLATALGVSRGPLREAIRRLEGRRLLDRKANVGVSVTELSPQRLDDLLTVRESLEGMACRLASQRMSDAEIDDMRKLLASHSRRREIALGEGYYQESGDVDFHFRIAAASGNELLTSMVTGDLYDLLRVYRYKSSTMTGRTSQALEEHRAIVEALASRDPDQAEQAMRTHIRNARLYAQMALEKAEKEAETS
ncbi:GntR family transcriptional regulator [Roseitranquillus sediminis]|uniref:GntR family transcriptional regulator n=1 Tax=Roseitranquillus sediminis TaxID=2809051 RepID=UPI001D0C8D91|nr:GntR family transcriptional regulator [Roseitranquillus sediminis]MBM9593860.1 GntR family transcriptional regulator [Roseitranquillus sediminis]